MTEIWKAVVGWEGLYEVSDLGRVRSLDRLRKGGAYPGNHGSKGRVLTPGMSGFKRRYAYVGLKRYGKIKNVGIHALVLTAFVGFCPKGKEGCHGKLGAEVNTFSNLRWGTKKENAADAKNDGTTARGERAGAAKLTEKAVHVIRSAPWTRQTASKLAERFGVRSSQIRRVRKGERWIS